MLTTFTFCTGNMPLENNIGKNIILEESKGNMSIWEK